MKAAAPLLLSCSFVVFAFSPTASAATSHLMVAPQTLRSDEVTLMWDKPENSGAGANYQVLRDGQSVGTTTKTHFTVRALAPEHDYVFTVVAGPAANAKTIDVAGPLTVRTPAKETTISVLDHGAVGDGQTLNTKALQAAIDACRPHGVVLIPAGVFLSGALYLKSDMTLQIAKGGVLKGTSNPQDYTPFNHNRFEGWEMDTHASLLNAGTLDRAGPANVRNLSIRGEGKISGGGRKLSDAIIALYPKSVDGLRARGRLILVMNAENVEVAGLTLEETPCWCLHYIYSANVSLHGLAIHSDVRNGDGIDPDSSRNSYIFDSSFDTGDDCIAIKSGKNPEGNIVNRPTENVRIVDCRFERGHGISIGSEISGGVRGVLVEDCVAGDLIYGLQIKATPERGGFVEDVTVRDCDLRMISILTALPYNNDGEGAPTQPIYRNFRFLDLDLTKANPAKPIIIVNGFPAEGHQTQHVSFANLKLPAGATVTVDRADDVSFSKVTTAGGGEPTYQITRSQGISR